MDFDSERNRRQWGVGSGAGGGRQRIEHGDIKRLGHASSSANATGGSASKAASGVLRDAKATARRRLVGAGSAIVGGCATAERRCFSNGGAGRSERLRGGASSSGFGNVSASAAVQAVVLHGSNVDGFGGEMSGGEFATSLAYYGGGCGRCDFERECERRHGRRYRNLARRWQAAAPMRAARQCPAAQAAQLRRQVPSAGRGGSGGALILVPAGLAARAAADSVAESRLGGAISSANASGGIGRRAGGGGFFARGRAAVRERHQHSDVRRCRGSASSASATGGAGGAGVSTPMRRRRRRCRR